MPTPYGYIVTSECNVITITVRPGLGASMNGDNRLQPTLSFPTLSASTITAFPSTIVGAFSASKFIRVSGTLLYGAPGDITITAPTNFQVSNDNSTWGSSTTIPFTSDTISNVQVYVRFSPTSVGNLSGNLSITGGGVTVPVFVPVSGTAIAAPSLTASALNPFPNTVPTNSSASQYFELEGADLIGASGLITITAPNTNFQVSTNNANWFSSVTVAYSASSLPTTSIYVRFTPQSVGTKSGNISVSGGGATTTVAVTGNGVVEMSIGAVGLTYLKFDDITSSATYYINWGDGTTDTFTSGTSSPTHTYSTAFTGNIKLQVNAYTNITKFDIAGGANEPQPASNTNFPVVIQGSEIAKLTALTWLITKSSSRIVSVTTSQLANTISTLRLDYSQLSGTVGNLPAALTGCSISAGNTISGTLASLFTKCPLLTLFEVEGANTISGTITSLSTSMYSFIVLGSNTISGNLNTLPVMPSLIAFYVGGNNYIAGDLSDFDFTNVIIFGIGGNKNHYQPTSNITGDIDSITFNNAMITFIVNNGLNTISGDIDSFPTSLTKLEVGGESDVYTSSGNTLTGDITELPPSLTTVSIFGKNTISGDVSNWSYPDCIFYGFGGLNTLSGDLNDIPPNVKFVNISSVGNTISTYTGTRTWGQGSMYYLSVLSNTFNNQSQINQLFQDLDGSTWLSSADFAKTIRYRGLTPTGAGLTAKTNLETVKGVTVTIVAP